MLFKILKVINHQILFKFQQKWL